MLLAAVFLATPPLAVSAEPAPLRIETSTATGVARFVSAEDGGPIEVPRRAGRPELEPIDFFHEHGHLFGITDPAEQLALVATRTDALGSVHTTFQQMHQGVPVFAGLLRVHQDAAGRVASVNGTFIPGIQVSKNPVLGPDDAAAVALKDVRAGLDRAVELTAEVGKLYIFRANLARGVPGSNHLVYEVEVGDGISVREFVYVDAHKPYVVDRITGIHEAIDRRIYDGGFGDPFLVWSEGDALPFGDTDIDNLIEYAEDTYNVFASATDGAFLSWDGVDGTMHSVNNDPNIACPNANWNGTSTNFCSGVTGDDTVGHEWGHAYTDSTHNLIYQWQSGALNESYSDIFGEVVDLLNGSGFDDPGAFRTAGACSTFGGSPLPDFDIHAPAQIAGSYTVGGAHFNPPPPLSATADVELVNDGNDEGGAGTVTDGCQTLVGSLSGRIALIDRGACSFTTKVLNAQAAGAVAVIIVNNQGDGVFNMGGFDPSIAIPSVMLGQGEGDTVKAELPGVNATVALSASTDVSVRWLASEDDPAFGGAIRDMWNPTCYGDPGKVTDTGQYVCGTGDSGGVHSNSGIPNHGFALLADGGTYNGETITGIGLTKAFHIYWRAASVYQVPATNFADHANALEQSCQDLIGVNLFDLDTDAPMGVPSGEVIGAGDCAELASVIAAVELRIEPTFCGFVPMLDADAPPLCGGPGMVRRILLEDWEAGMGGWTVGTRALADPATFDTPDWAIVGGLPDGRAGAAMFVADLVIGDCAADTEAGVLFLESPVIPIPTGAVVPRLAFDHWVATEMGWDGGNVKISVNGGGWTVIPFTQFEFNAYAGWLIGDSNDNPLGGEEAFTGADGGEVTGSWGQSQINLAGLAGPGDSVLLRFEMGLDGCNGVHGWYVDDVHAYYCCALPGDVECDGTVEMDDYAAFADCLSGPGESPNPTSPTTASDCLAIFDADADADIDLDDFAALQRGFGTP